MVEPWVEPQSATTLCGHLSVYRADAVNPNVTRQKMMLRLTAIMTIAALAGCDANPQTASPSLATSGSIGVPFRGETLNAVYLTRVRGDRTLRSGILIVLADLDEVNASVSVDQDDFTTITLNGQEVALKGRPLVIVTSDAGIIVSTQQLGAEVDDRDSVAEWTAKTLDSISDLLPNKMVENG